MNELAQDPSLEKFRNEYQRLHTALKSSHEREIKYLKQCKELNDAIVMDSIGVESALRQTQEDENVKNNLIKELDTVKKIIKGLRERDLDNQSKIKTLQETIDKINQSLKDSKMIKNTKDNEITDLTTEIETLQKESQNQAKQLHTMEILRNQDQQKFGQIETYHI